MKTSALLTLTGLAATVIAQNSRPSGTLLDAVPECARKCLSDAVTNATNCKIEDGDCVCIPDNYYAIYDAGTQCVLLECGAGLSVEEVLPQAQQYCADVTGGSAEVTGTEIITALPTKTSAASSSGTAASQASESAADSDNADATTTGAAPAATTSDEPDAAVSLPRLGSLGLLAIGAFAAF
ncbi:hypothetical protein F5X68DRAFT_277114 [Plectosphaerella plurivora]|uniref:CFEM domain-containing protein n=1 Tax=Plectosphaerella plurivora TaxID=936078 RepID=A0A9P9AAL3_9PEZI|nr:hypothetical protein F5X68DRAFT_277114 [Plectosphaerella plurivora]